MCRIDLSRSLFRCLILTSCLALLVTGCCTARYQGYGPHVAGYDGGAGCSDCDGGGCASCGPAFPRSCGSCLGGCGGLSGILMPLLGNRMACGSGCGEVYWNEWVSDPPVCDPCNECGQWTGGGYGNGGCGAGGCGGACWNGAVGRGPFPIIGGIVRGALRFTGSLLHTVLYGYHGPYPGHGGCMSCDSYYGVEDPYSWGQNCSGGGCSSGCSSCMNGGGDGEYIEDGGEYYHPSSEPDMVPTPAEVPADELPPSAARRPNSPRASNTPRSARNRMANPRMRR